MTRSIPQSGGQETGDRTADTGRAPIRLTVALTHPVQYLAPWFRHVARTCPQLRLTVVYAAVPSPAQQGQEFGTAFEWDLPLLDGYESVVVRPAAPRDDFRSVAFRGLDVPELVGAVRATAPDVVLVPGWYSITLVRVIRACRRAGIPLLYRGDSILLGPPHGLKRVLRNIRARYFLRQYSAFLCVGTRSREYLTSFGVPEASLFDSPHCVDNDFFENSRPHRDAARREFRQSRGLEPERFVVAFVGKIEPQKRPLDLVRAAATLGKDFTLLVVGDGPQLEVCRREAERLEVRVAWEGFRNQSELARLYPAADCLVLPSERETWGLVVNEALAARVPCVVSDMVGCAPDLVVPGHTGEVFPVGDVEALAERIARVRGFRRPAADAVFDEVLDRHSFQRATQGLLAACQHVLFPTGSRVRREPAVCTA